MSRVVQHKGLGFVGVATRFAPATDTTWPASSPLLGDNAETASSLKPMSPKVLASNRVAGRNFMRLHAAVSGLMAILANRSAMRIHAFRFSGGFDVSTLRSLSREEIAGRLQTAVSEGGLRMLPKADGFVDESVSGFPARWCRALTAALLASFSQVR